MRLAKRTNSNHEREALIEKKDFVVSSTLIDTYFCPNLKLD
jgi:hypothetical protein